MIIKNAQIVDVARQKIYSSDLLVKGDKISQIGVGITSDDDEVIDAAGAYLIPGLINAHVHIESSHLLPSYFGELVLQNGTTAAICDPHEIVNVAGEDGLSFMLEDGKRSPCDLFFMLPSCVPSTSMETAGATLTAADTARIFDRYPELLGLGEMMNVPGVLFKDQEVHGKLDAAKKRGKIIDGHYPLGSGETLKEYCRSGITSDHESISQEEALEKVAAGMTVFIREGGSAKNLEALIGAVNKDNYKSFAFCTDDTSASYLTEKGDILFALRKAVSLGLDPLLAIALATLNPAEHYKLSSRGEIKENYLADLLLVDNLKDFTIKSVIKGGKLYTTSPADTTPPSAPTSITQSVNLKKPFKLDFPKPPPTAQKARVIGILPTEIITENTEVPITELNSNEIAYAAVVSRYGNGNISYGYVKGTSLKQGAVAQSIGHDSHNITVIGKTISDMETAVNEIEKMQGGVAVVINGKATATLPLPYAGLLSSQNAEKTANAEDELILAIRATGIDLPSPVITMAFISLPVMPALKLTDIGLVDVNGFQFTDLYI